jgi:cytochrome P450
MFFAGADTTVSGVETILAMLANPVAQKKVQAEIDSVTGQKYLPTFEDRDSMPYVSALLKEALRWENVAPFGSCPFLRLITLCIPFCCIASPLIVDRG